MCDKTSAITGCADEELVVGPQNNDDAAFAELMRRTSPDSLRPARSIFEKGRQEAEDEARNSYLKA